MSRSSSGFSGRRRRSKSRSRILRFSDIMPHPVQLAIQQMALPFPVEQLAQVLLFDSLFFVCLFLPTPPVPGLALFTCWSYQRFTGCLGFFA